MIAPPAIYLIPVRESVRKDIKVSAQNAYIKKSGAFTGEIRYAILHIPYLQPSFISSPTHTLFNLPPFSSPAQLVDAQIPYVILGHSERRTLFHETSDLIAQKTRAALDEGLSVILCVGETLAEREANQTAQVVQAQLKPVVDALKAEDWKYVLFLFTPGS